MPNGKRAGTDSAGMPKAWQPALFGAGGRELRRTDHVARGVDVRDGGLEMFVHGHTTAAVGGQAGFLEAQAGGIPLAPRRDQQGVGI